MFGLAAQTLLASIKNVAARFRWKNPEKSDTQVKSFLGRAVIGIAFEGPDHLGPPFRSQPVDEPRLTAFARNLFPRHPPHALKAVKRGVDQIVVQLPFAQNCSGHLLDFIAVLGTVEQACQDN